MFNQIIELDPCPIHLIKVGKDICTIYRYPKDRELMKFIHFITERKILLADNSISTQVNTILYSSNIN